MNFYSINEINKISYKFPSIYFCPDYCKCCEHSDNCEIEYCLYKDLIYVYLKKKREDNSYELISPYGYSGYYFEDKTTLIEFIELFNSECIKRNYNKQIIRQTPFISNKVEELKIHYNILKIKTLFCVKFNDNNDYFDKYFYNDINSKKRNMYNKAKKMCYLFNSCKLKIDDVNENSEFRIMYNNTMNNVNSNVYYYFNDNYFNELANLPFSYLTWVEYYGKKVGFAIILLDNDYIHYHLSCNDRSNNCIMDYLLFEIMQTFCKNKIFILGCGVNEDDNLHKFKKSLSNYLYNYLIYSK